MIWKTFVFAFLLVGVFAQQYEITEEKKEQFKNMLKTHCKKMNVDDKGIEDVTKSAHAFVDCIKELVNFDTLKNEIEQAKPNGALDEVFKKYCAKSPQLKSCIGNLLDGVSPCLDETARDQISSAKNGTAQLIDFVCYKDGDRIALFISEQGPECFSQKVNGIRACADKIKDAVKTVDNAKALTIPERCGKFDELSKCIVEELEKCETPTPGNMAESLFKYVRKGSPCNTALPLSN